jgi:hypothetical protein
VRRAALYAALLLSAGFYCYLGAFSSLQPTEEGLVVYPSWRVMQGALPYRDVQHMYGPAVFFLNATLFSLFGEDLAVTRWSLIAVRAVLGLLVYALARQVASRPAALLVWAVFVVVWGTPIWVFNSPYANHYGLPLSLLGLLAFLSFRPRYPFGLIAAGICIGVAALFKQTLGAFYAIALVMALTHEKQRPRAADEPRTLAVSTAALAVGAALLLFLAYTWRGLDSWSTLLLLAPILFGTMLLAYRELRGENAARTWYEVRDPVTFGIAAMAPLATCAILYWTAGALEDLVADTISVLPHSVIWFVPLPSPGTRTILHATTIVAFMALARSHAAGRSRAARLWAVALVVAAVASLTLAPPGTWGWVGDIANLLWWAPLVTVVAFSPMLRPQSDKIACPPHRGALVAMWFFAAAAVLQLYPAADLAHVGMILPACLPLIAKAIDRFVGFGSQASPRKAPILAVLVTAAITAAPFLHVQQLAAARQSAEIPGFARASGVRISEEMTRHAVALVAFLEHQQADLFVIANQPLLYFLSAHPSPFDRDELVFYLVGTGLISDEEARRLTSEEAIIDRLEEAQPLIVYEDTTPAAQRFRAAFPRVASYINEHYRSAEAFGSYRVWRPRRSKSPRDHQPAAKQSNVTSRSARNWPALPVRPSPELHRPPTDRRRLPGDTDESTRSFGFELPPWSDLGGSGSTS